jgi:tetratricopeptide (TPR) repeat protein
MTRHLHLGPTQAFLLCCLLAAAVYFPGLTGDYLFDDTTNLLGNKALEFESLDADTLRKAAFSSKAGELRRPVSMASFALNRYFLGIDPYSYKLINLVIHLLTGLALFLLTRQIVGNYRELHRPDLSPGVMRWLPVVVCGLWLVHPLNLTSVLYIVQRMTSLSSLFMVCALCLYMIGRRRMLDGRHGLSWILGGLFMFGGLSIFSKETGILLPLYMLVLELTLFRFRMRSGLPDRQIIVFFVACVLLPLLAGTLYLLANFDAYINYTRRTFTLAERLLTEPRVVLFYLQMIVAPTVQQLGLYHDDISVSTGLLSPPATLFSAVFLGALLTGGLLLRNRLPLVSLGILWFFVGQLLESTIFPLELVHEHRNYLPGFGIILAIAGLVAGLPVRRLAPVIQVIAPLLLLAVFASTTWLRSTQWSNNVDHSVYEARHHPQSPRAVFAAGRIHARLALEGHTESVDKAYEFLGRASALDYSGIMPDVTMLKLDYLLGREVDPGRFDEIVSRLERYPLSTSDVTSLQDLADCLGGKCSMAPETVDRIFNAALRNGNIRLKTVYAYYIINQRGKFLEGLALFENVVERRPKEPQYWINLINLLMVMARFDEAEQRLEQFRDLRPYGSSEADFSMLQDDIDRGRLEFAHSYNSVADNNRP